MLSDIEIAQGCDMLYINEVAAELNILPEEREFYGHFKAKLNGRLWERVKTNKDGRLILVTAINPTPAGEGKTTTCIGLGMALNRLGKKAIITLREPSLGPVMGVKGGAAGGGYSQVVPMEDINLHFTGDIHAVTAANNLLSALIDNHIHQGNALRIDPRQVTWKRAMDMNDRALRNIVVGLGGMTNGTPREDGFQITVASEVMAILCLATDLMDLKERLANIIFGYSYDGKPLTAGDLKAEGAMALLLKDAILPNLVQTLEHTPVLIHGGPFANIAHGCNSISATRLALKLGDYCVTEAGFGADLGAEKFFDIKCRYGGLTPDATVIVATIRALKYNGGIKKDGLKEENLPALKKGIVNLEKHVENIRKFGVPVLVAINHFHTDTDAEIDFVKQACKDMDVEVSFSEVFSKGGEGGLDMASKLMQLMDARPSQYKPLYDMNQRIKEKISIIAREIYGASDVKYSSLAEKAIRKIEEMGKDRLPICMAKTQYSLSDKPELLGRPEGFTLAVRDLTLSAGAGFIVVLTGDVMTMPGLPKSPSAERIDILENGSIQGLF